MASQGTRHDMNSDPERLTIIPNDYTRLFRPLNEARKEFRYLMIESALPGRQNQMISCILVHASLLDNPIPQYEALSHYWGDINETTKICLRLPPVTGLFTEEGWPISLCEQEFIVTYTLEDALLQLRRPWKDGPRCVWIDAICINQKDVKERSQQVSLMREIYANARQTTIWLGRMDTESHRAMLWLTQLGFYLEEAWNIKWLDWAYRNVFAVEVVEAEDRIGSLSFQGEMNDHDVLAALSWLFCRPWFRRLWVLQEVGVASKVVLWGEEDVAVPWGLVVLAMFWQEYHLLEYTENESLRRRSAPQSERAAPHLWRMLTELETNHRLDILTLLHSARRYKSTDTRDRIFALLGLGDDTHVVDRLVPSQRPDYSKTKAQVLRDFTYSYICEQRSLDILSAALFPNSVRDSSLPSWIPTYIGIGPPNCIGYPRPSYRAAGTSFVMISDCPDQSSLLLQGIRVDRIQSISMETCAGEGSSFEPYYQAMKSHWSRLKKYDSYPTGEDLVDVFLEILCCCSWDRATFRPNAHFKNFVSCWRNSEPALESFSEEQRGRLLAANGGIAFNFNVIFGRSLHYRWFCTTERGYAGLVPYGSKPGDLVVVLYGGSVLYVLRPLVHPTPSGGRVKHDVRPSYELIGECYIHGQMDGDIITDQRTYHIPNEIYDIQ